MQAGCVTGSSQHLRVDHQHNGHCAGQVPSDLAQWTRREQHDRLHIEAGRHLDHSHSTGTTTLPIQDRGNSSTE